MKNTVHDPEPWLREALTDRAPAQPGLLSAGCCHVRRPDRGAVRRAGALGAAALMIDGRAGRMSA
jgi:hypothetical protein